MNKRKQNSTEGFTPTPILKILSIYSKYFNFIELFNRYLRSSVGIGVSLRSKRGFTLIEMLIYIALMATITLAVTQSLIVVLRSNRTSFVEVNIRNSGYSAMEGMLREIYLSESVDQASSGVLEMRQNIGANVVRFATSSDSVLNFYEGSGVPTLVGPLTSKGILVKNLIFTKINTGRSLAIRIQMELETSVNETLKSEWFYGTAILRGSY